jgi:hypothetical protein
VIGRILRVLGPLLAFALLSAESCDFELNGLINKPAAITVTNLSASETAVVAIIADDVKSYPTLTPGQSVTVKSNVGGTYQVRVVMTQENATEYRAELLSLRRLVERQIDGTASSDEKITLFTNLAGIKAAIQGFESGNAAGCSGKVTQKTDEEVAVQATETWQATSVSGFRDTSCASN